MSERQGFLHDETGRRSSARALLWLVVLATLVLIFLDAARGKAFEIAGEAYTLLGAITSGLMLWAGGARFAQHAAPALASMVGSVKDAVRRDPRLPSRTDDERGEREQ